jgi:hypothetical protein
MANPNWVKGCESPNPAGNIRYRERFKQVQKKSSLEKKIALYLTKRWARMVTDLDSLPEKDRVRAYLELMQYSTPKKAAVSADNLTPDQIDLLYDKIITMANAKAN